MNQSFSNVSSYKHLESLTNLCYTEITKNNEDIKVNIDEEEEMRLENNEAMFSQMPSEQQPPPKMEKREIHVEEDDEEYEESKHEQIEEIDYEEKMVKMYSGMVHESISLI